MKWATKQVYHFITAYMGVVLQEGLRALPGEM